VIGIVGGTVTAAARSLGHTISFIITQTMMIGMCFYMYYQSPKRHGRHLYRYGPFYFVLLSVPLVMADLTRHILQDTNVWPEPGSAEYRDGCPTENVTCLSTVGIIFTIICTYFGFTFLAIGVLWNAKIWDKLKEIKGRWNAIRRGEVSDDE